MHECVQNGFKDKVILMSHVNPIQYYSDFTSFTPILSLLSKCATNLKMPVLNIKQSLFLNMMYSCNKIY